MCHRKSRACPNRYPYRATGICSVASHRWNTSSSMVRHSFIVRPSSRQGRLATAAVFVRSRRTMTIRAGEPRPFVVIERMVGSCLLASRSASSPAPESNRHPACGRMMSLPRSLFGARWRTQRGKAGISVRCGVGRTGAPRPKGPVLRRQQAAIHSEPSLEEDVVRSCARMDSCLMDSACKDRSRCVQRCQALFTNWWVGFLSDLDLRTSR